MSGGKSREIMGLSCMTGCNTLVVGVANLLHNRCNRCIKCCKTVACNTSSSINVARVYACGVGGFPLGGCARVTVWRWGNPRKPRVPVLIIGSSC